MPFKKTGSKITIATQNDKKTTQVELIKIVCYSFFYRWKSLKVQECISSDQYHVFTQGSHLRGKLSAHFVTARSTCYELMSRDKKTKWNKSSPNKNSVIKSFSFFQNLIFQSACIMNSSANWIWFHSLLAMSVSFIDLIRALSRACDKRG